MRAGEVRAEMYKGRLVTHWWLPGEPRTVCGFVKAEKLLSVDKPLPLLRVNPCKDCAAAWARLF